MNALFLVFIAFFVFVESIERIFHPPHIHGDQLILVSVLGLLVNMIGLFFFHDATHHHEEEEEAHAGHGGHSHCGHSHGGHSHGGHSHAHEGHNHNMQGIFLHVLADALGSVGVIISSVLIRFLGWLVADALCSLMISALIFMSVVCIVLSRCIIAGLALFDSFPDQFTFTDSFIRQYCFSAAATHSRRSRRFGSLLFA